MARERMVTRTVETNEVTVMVVNTDSKKVYEHTVSISGAVKDEKELLKKAKALLEGDVSKVVAIVSNEVKEVLYGMPEQEFITLAKVLPPRSTTNANED